MQVQAVEPAGPAGGARPAGDPAPARVPWPVAVVLAGFAGLALLLAFPPYGVFLAAPLAVGLLALAVHRQRVLVGAGLGLLAGLVFFVPILSWTNLHTGKLPWLLLSVAEAAYFALLGAGAAYASPLVDRWRWAWPALTGLLWVTQEALRDHTPFGGFPWARLAFSQGDSPLLRLAAAGGAPLVTFGVAAAGGLLAAAVLVPAPPGRAAPAALRWGVLRARPPAWLPVGGLGGGWSRQSATVVAMVGAAAAVVLVGMLVPLRAPAGAPVTVAVVQGNVPRLGLDFNAQRRAVLDNHVRATVALAERVAIGDAPQPALVVWPENSSDIDPLRAADAADAIDRAARAIKAPILVGAVLRGPGPGKVRNAGLLWRPEGGPDLDQTYIKRHPVPFAEYVPLRTIARMVSKEVDRVSSDFVAGTEPGVLRTGAVVVGDVICFEVAYDEVVRDTVTGGAQVLAVQTNNATFNEAEALQQLAMVRLRAVEHGREALMASTVGVSAFVTADGTVIDATAFNSQAVVVREMSTTATRTLATTLGHWPEVVLVALTVVVLAGAVVVRRRAGAAVDRPRRGTASRERANQEGQ